MVSVSEKSVSLRNQYRPSELTREYSIDLQVIVMGACPTIDCCEKVNSPMLCTVSEAYPEFYTDQGERVENTAIVWMRGQLIAVSAFANVRDKMSDWQMTALCQQILADNPTITMLEFVLFCARLRSGKYESFYGSIDPMRILKSFDEFLSDRRIDYSRKLERQEQERRERETEETKKNAVSLEWVIEQCKQGKLPNVAKMMSINVETKNEDGEPKGKKPTSKKKSKNDLQI